MENYIETSTYSGRKIRVESQECVEKQSSIMEKDCMTFGEAIKAGVVKEGMRVIFEHATPVPIEITQEMSGVEEKVCFFLREGMVAKNANGEFAIYAYLWCCLDKWLGFQGRFARANAARTIEYILSNVLNIKASLFLIEDLPAACTAHFFADFIAGYDTAIFTDKDHRLVTFDGASVQYIDFRPGGPIKEYNKLAICMGESSTICQIKDNIRCETTAPFYYGKSPFQKHLYISGAIK